MNSNSVEFKCDFDDEAEMELVPQLDFCTSSPRGRPQMAPTDPSSSPGSCRPIAAAAANAIATHSTRADRLEGPNSVAAPPLALADDSFVRCRLRRISRTRRAARVD